MTDFPTDSPLISCDQLHRLLSQDATDNPVVILDGSWYLPMQNRDGHAEFSQARIPGANYFDINAVSDQATNLPHMLPDANAFGESVGRLGITNQSLVVVYDGAGLFSAARVWWMFRLFGHDRVKVLDGGLPAWIEAGYELDQSKPHRVPATEQFDAELNDGLVASMEMVRENCDRREYRVLDARPLGRFTGEAPEPRPELPSGHMPGATSLPFTDLLRENRLCPEDELKAKFHQLDIEVDTPVITSCGSGVTAAVITLAMEVCGLGLNRLYDGSWSEWASHGDNPIETDQ